MSRVLRALLEWLAGRRSTTSPAPTAEPFSQSRSGQDSGIDAIRRGHPVILDHLSEAELDLIRPFAEKEFHGDVTRAADWHAIDLTGDMPANVAIRMLSFHGLTVQNLIDWHLSGVVDGFEIMSATDACAFCRRFPRGPYGLDEGPEVPLDGCTHKMGCRCTILPHI